ncbi:MAG TPA: acyl-CoA dehydrogenase family protein [Trebonia sp.]|jgi:alkylation response protein AidB-like acyl-CoA dehydrogenase|nr:acyl-CoA dehydrogenase family protein [Trebonia sp.]
MRLPTDDELALRDVCREVLTKRTTSARIRLIAESEAGFDQDFWKLVVGLGWTALPLPEHAGGLDGTVAMLAVVAEELGRALQPGPLVQTLAVAYVLGRHTPARGVSDLLASIAEGTAIATWAGLGPDSPEPVVERDGALHGTVEFVPDAGAATHLAVPVRTTTGLRLEVVDLGAARVEAVPALDLTRRYDRVRLDGVPLPAVQLPTEACALLFDLGLVLQCAESTGIAGRLLGMTVTYARQREQFGRPIGSFQALKHRMADMLVEAEGCRVATREAADALDGGAAPGGEAVSIAKSWVGRAASFVASHALQVHGGIGFSWDHDLHLFLRRAKANELLLGTPGWHEERLYRSVLATGKPDE